MTYRKSKRIFDIIFSSVLIVLLSPLILILFILVAIFLKENPVFSQIRPGLNGRLFRLYKFKTMKTVTLDNGDLAPDEYRLTNFGRKLRNSSLDELPSVFNILSGNLSFVGPRPLLPEYLDLYTTNQMRRHEVLPGLTGWAQINGRNSIDWKKKLELDVWYVDNQSFWLDLKILALTIKKVIFKENINTVGEATASRFTGSKDN